MKRILLFVLLCGALLGSALAQDADSNTPATKEDVARYFEVVHSRQMVDQMMGVMSRSIRQMTHDQYLKNKDKLPQDFEEHANKHVDEMLKNMPWDEMMQAMMPAYQRHFTKGDIDSLVAFYSSATGQKLLRELPGILSDSMQAMTPILEKYMDSVKGQVNDEFAQALKHSDRKSNCSHSINGGSLYEKKTGRTLLRRDNCSANDPVVRANSTRDARAGIEKLDFMAGNWTSEGDMKASPGMPGGKVSISSHAEWMEGNFFLIEHSDADMGAMGKFKELAVLGYDADRKVYTYHAFNSMGQDESSAGTVDGDTWTWLSDEHFNGMTMKGRFTMKVLSPTSYTMKYELSQDGTNWMTAMEGKATKK